jgi:hypothetical protein
MIDITKFLIHIIDKESRAHRRKKMMTISLLIEELKKYPCDAKIDNIRNPHCYRRNNDIAFEKKKGTRTVQSLVDELNSCIGKTFIGWKGGEFEMDKDTPVWVSEKGECIDNSIASIVRMRKNLRFSIVNVEDDFDFIEKYLK